MPRTLEFVSEEVLERMRELGLIKEGALIAYKIRKEFWNGLKREHGSHRAVEILADKYRLSEKRIENIVYVRKSRERIR